MDEYTNQNIYPQDGPENQQQAPEAPASGQQQTPAAPASEQQAPEAPVSGQQQIPAAPASGQQADPPFQSASEPYRQEQPPFQQAPPSNDYQGWQNQQSYNQQPYNQQPYNQQPYNQQPYNQQPPKQSNGLALASMIVGIFALLACCIPFIQFPLAVISIVLVIISKKGKPLSGFAIAGLVMSIIAILISIGMTIYWGFLIRLMSDPEFMSTYGDLFQVY